AFALWITFVHKHSDARLLLTLLTVIAAGLLLFNGLGLWTSTLSPKVANFDAMWNNRLSFGANVVMFCGMVAPYLIAIGFSERLAHSDLSRFWWAPPLLLILSACFYLFSMKMIEPVLNWRRKKLTNLIAGASDK